MAEVKQGQNIPDLYHKDSSSIETFDYLNFGATPLVEYRDPYNCLNCTNSSYSPVQTKHLHDDYNTEPISSNQSPKQNLGFKIFLFNT